MRKIKKTGIIFCLLIFLHCNSTWMHINEKNVKEIRDKSVLIDKIEQTNGTNHFMKSELYKFEDCEVIKTEFFSDTLMRIKSETYLKDSLLIRQTTAGIVALSPPVDEQSPYAKVFEEVYYFYSTRNGILHERKVEIKNFTEYENAKSTLRGMNYDSKELNHKDYIKIKEEYKQTIELYKKH